MRKKLTAIAASSALLFASAMSVAASLIPLGVHDGIYTVPVQINRTVTAEFLVDSGSSVVVIPENMLKTLIARGTVTQEDILGTGTAMLADTSLYKSVQLRIRELRVGDIVLRDVLAAVSPSLIQPILGQSFLGRFGSVTFDNQRRLLMLQ
ncbi:MAG TPA: retropepsin-like aspartic protease [Stellaceae bacterium]|jgi:predicted aspartyl protease|nr:retropepsin-like aspartic protease [Stellaceae bacterium]